MTGAYRTQEDGRDDRIDSLVTSDSSVSLLLCDSCKRRDQGHREGGRNGQGSEIAQYA